MERGAPAERLAFEEVVEGVRERLISLFKAGA